MFSDFTPLGVLTSQKLIKSVSYFNLKFTKGK